MLFTSQLELVPTLLTSVQKSKRENDHSSSKATGLTLLTLVKRVKQALTNHSTNTLLQTITFWKRLRYLKTRKVYILVEKSELYLNTYLFAYHFQVICEIRDSEVSYKTTVLISNI